MSIVLQFYPNGEFSQGVDTSSNRPPKHVCKTLQTSPSGRTYTIADIERVKSLYAEIQPQTYNVLGYEFVSSIGVHYILRETTEAHCVLQRVGDVSEYNLIHINLPVQRAVFLGFLSPLVHQSVQSSESLSSRKKLKTMTKRMGRNIRNGVYLLEQDKGGKDCLSFLTLTLPALSDAGLSACCQKWDYMVSRFLDWLGTRVKRYNIPFRYVYCTEIQSKRLQSRGEYAPHLHIVFRGRNGKKDTWAITPKQARRAWGACISSVTDDVFDNRSLENLQRIRFSAARYLSKYLSKGSDNISSETKEDYAGKLHTQWGGMARSVSRQIKRCTQRFVGNGEPDNMASSIYRHIPEFIQLGFISYFKQGFISLAKCQATGVERGLHVGCGALQTPTYSGGLLPIVQFIAERHSSLL